MHTTERFKKFLKNLTLTDDQIKKGKERREALVSKLNLKYYSHGNAESNSIYVGSWGKLTRIRPPRDVDVLYELPKSVYDRFQSRIGNKQSQLLQEIRDYLLTHFKTTDIRGDGPVIIVPFQDYNVELIPAFRLDTGRHYVCRTNSGGRYKIADYAAEAKLIADSNNKTNGNTRHLIRMMKCWQANCSVPFKSFWIELTAVNFLSGWEHSGKSELYYDFMVRDYLKYLISIRYNTIYAPGTGEPMYISDAWFSRAQTAYDRSIKACELESSKNPEDAGEEWQKIFGLDIPKWLI